MRITVDKKLWPLVRVTVPEEVSDEDVAVYLEQLRAIREVRAAYAILVDLRDAAPFTARQRRMQAEYMKSGLDLSSRYLKGLAFVTDNRFKRGILQAIFWLQPPPAPFELFASLQEATQWAFHQLSPSTASPSVSG